MNTHRQIWVVVAVTAMLISAGCTRGPDTLYGVFWDNTASIEKLVAIDPSTGALTQVGAGITNCCFISSGVSTLDPDGDVFYFVGRESTPPDAPQRIYSIDLVTGTVLSNPVLPSGNNHNFIGFDRTAGTLYGVVYDHAISMEKLVSINTSTGGLTAIGSPIADCCGVPSGVSTVDPNNGIFYFVGSLMSESNYRIFGLSTATGAVLTNPTLPANHNHNFIEFDPAAREPEVVLAAAAAGD